MIMSSKNVLEQAGQELMGQLRNVRDIVQLTIFEMRASIASVIPGNLHIGDEWRPASTAVKRLINYISPESEK